MHYEDIWNLCKTHNYLYKIICTPYFIECWKKYNITTVKYQTAKTANTFFRNEHVDVDRLKFRHGRTIKYDQAGGIIESFNYVQGILNGLYGQYANVIKNGSYTLINFTNGLRQGLMNAVSNEGVVCYASYDHDKLHGLYRRYFPNGHVEWIDYSEDIANLNIKWYPHGGRQQMDVGTHKHIYWFVNGCKKKEIINNDDDTRHVSTWFDNGNRETEFTLSGKTQRYNGEYKRWDINGKLELHRHYYNGDFIDIMTTVTS
jgi:antitoxin component YwqK of YwqJK toxin-antitoxin module